MWHMASGRLCLHPVIQMLPAVVSRRRHLQGLEDVSNRLALVQELFSSARFANDLYSYGEAFGYGVAAFAFHGASHGQFWPVGKLS